MPTVIPSLIYILDLMVEKQRINLCAMLNCCGTDNIKAGVICRAETPGVVRHYMQRGAGRQDTTDASLVGQNVAD